jgi:hypothetical protein
MSKNVKINESSSESSSVIETTNKSIVPVVNDNSGGIIQSIKNMFPTNNYYIYVLIAIIVVGGGLYYYYYIKNKKNPLVQSETKLEPLPVSNQNPPIDEIKILQQQMYERQKTAEMENAYQQQIMNLQMQLNAQQQYIQDQRIKEQTYEKQQKNKSKIQHPNHGNVSSENSEDINNELAKLNVFENDNVTRHNLTNTEIAELTNTLNNMNI